MENEATRTDTPTAPATVAATTCGWAVASLAGALIGPFYLFPIGAILAILFGYVARADIRRSQGRLVGRGMALASLVIGYASIVLAVLVSGVLLPGRLSLAFWHFRIP